MADHFLGKYETEDEVLHQINKLKDEGLSESDMYILTQQGDQVSMIRGKTNVDTYAEQGNWMDRFTSFLTGNRNVDMAFDNMELTEQEKQIYYEALKKGLLLLYVNADYEARFREVGGDSFKLGEKEKTELQHRKEQSEKPTPSFTEQEERVKLDAHHYEDE